MIADPIDLADVPPGHLLWAKRAARAAFMEYLHRQGIDVHDSDVDNLFDPNGEGSW